MALFKTDLDWGGHCEGGAPYLYVGGDEPGRLYLYPQLEEGACRLRLDRDGCIDLARLLLEGASRMKDEGPERQAEITINDVERFSVQGACIEFRVASSVTGTRLDHTQELVVSNDPHGNLKLVIRPKDNPAGEGEKQDEH